MVKSSYLYPWLIIVTGIVFIAIALVMIHIALALVWLGICSITCGVVLWDQISQKGRGKW